VTLSKKPRKKVSFSYASEDREALAGFDYTATSGSAKIAARKRTATISVPLRSDPNDEYDRYFEVQLLSAKRAKLGDKSAKVTIADDDAPPTLRVTTDSVAEGFPDLRELTVSVSDVSYKVIEFSWAMDSGSATAGEDFQATSGTLAVPPGESMHQFTMFVLNDAIDEFDETFSVRLLNVSEASAAEGAHPVTITDDDAPPTVEVATASVAEGTSGTTVSPVSVELSGPSAKPVEVDFATTAGTATSPADFTATQGHFAFVPGETAKSFNLTVVSDYDDEPDETIGVAFTAPVNVTLPASTPTVGITDDDLACVSADAPGTALALGSLNGDAGTPSIVRNDLISPCGDSDWFGFTLVESSSSEVDLHARVFLTSGFNDSPQNGDVDLCVRISGNAASEVCSENAGGGVNERVDICVDDEFLAATDETTQFQVEVDGFGNAVNSYQLSISGNSVIGSGPTINIGGC
jgi:hypothetical protein